MNKTNSLYSLIKQKSKEKNRPLYLISDIDECISCFRPYAVFLFAQKNNYLKTTPFSEFFKEYWGKTSGGVLEKEIKYFGDNEEIRSLIESFMKLKEERAEKRKAEKKESSEVYNWFGDDAKEKLAVAPFLSICDELLLAIKENLIGKLLLVSSTHAIGASENEEIKKKKFAKTFGKLTNCEIEIIRIKKSWSKHKPYREEWARKNHPDFDIWVDDNDAIVESLKKGFPDRIYHVKPGKSALISDLTDQDFSIVALELKTKQLEKELKRERAKLYWIMGGEIVILLLVTLLVVIWKRKKYR